MVGVMMTSFKRTYARTVVFNAPDPTAGHCRPTPPLETPGHSQTSLAQSLVGSLLLPPGSWWAQNLVCALQDSYFPSPVEVLQSNPTGLQSQIPWGFSIPLPDPQIGKSVVNPRTFTTMREFLWHNCPPVWLFVRCLYDWVCMPLLPYLLQPEPLSPRQATADSCLRRRHSNTQRQVWLSLL